MESNIKYLWTIRTIYRDIKNLKKSKKKLKELTEQLKKSKDLKAVGKELKLEVQETPFFSLTDSIPGIGNIQEIKDSAFAVKPGETTHGETNFAYYLIKVLEFEKGAEPDDKELQGIYDRLKSVRANRVFKDWIDKVRESSDIQINKELVGAVWFFISGARSPVLFLWRLFWSHGEFFWPFSAGLPRPLRSRESSLPCPDHPDHK